MRFLPARNQFLQQGFIVFVQLAGFRRKRLVFFVRLNILYIRNADFADQIRLILRNIDDFKTVLSEGYQVHPTIFQPIHFDYLYGCTNKKGFCGVSHFVTFFDENDPERMFVIQAELNHQSIPLLKNVKGKYGTGKQHNVQWKERQFIFG